jgi:hypothetical protein
MSKAAMTAKAVAVAAAAVLGAGTAAAAVTGNLPGQSHAAAHLTVSGSSSTSSHHGSNNAPGGTTSGSIPSTGPANSHALFGLCTGFLAGQQNTTSTSTPPQDSSTAFKDLIAETGGSVAATTSFCQSYVQEHHPGKPSNTGKPSDTGKPSGAGKPANPGSSSSHSSSTSSHPSGTGASTHISGNASTTGVGSATSR